MKLSAPQFMVSAPHPKFSALHLKSSAPQIMVSAPHPKMFALHLKCLLLRLWCLLPSPKHQRNTVQHPEPGKHSPAPWIHSLTQGNTAQNIEPLLLAALDNLPAYSNLRIFIYASSHQFEIFSL